MKKIFKYSIAVTDQQEVSLDHNAKILTVQMQNETLCLWAIVDELSEKKRKRIIRIVGTGHPFEDEHLCKYITTFQMENGKLIFHVFEKDV